MQEKETSWFRVLEESKNFPKFIHTSSSDPLIHPFNTFLFILKKKQLERYRKGEKGFVLRCKNCVSEAEIKEREAAQQKKKNSEAKKPNDTEGTATLLKCISCEKKLPSTEFNKSQIAKFHPKSKDKGGRCRACVEQSLLNEKMEKVSLEKEKIEKAREKVKNAKNPVEKLKAESELSALEAEHVTGLKPVKMSSGRGRGRGRFGSSGRGRGRGRRQNF